MEIYKPIIEDLLSRNILVNINKNKIGSEESFKIVDSNCEREGVSPELKDGDDQNQTCDALQDFINDKFHNILIEKINIEVKNALNKTLIAEGVSDIVKKYELVISENTKENNHLKDIIIILKSDIEFLRNEVKSKD